jgi:hypothetical protein
MVVLFNSGENIYESVCVVFLIYGTIWFGIILIPFCFVCRYVLWKIYIQSPESCNDPHHYRL